MTKAVPSSITIEDAVARMVNMDYIPAGFTLTEMTAAFQEEAEVEYEKARLKRLPEEQIAPLKIRMVACCSRHALTHLLLESLQCEVKNPEGSIIVLAADSSGQQRVTLESVSDWAADKYGIGVKEWAHDSATVGKNTKNVRWEDVTIKIWKDYKIGFSFNGGKYKKSHFRKIGLMGVIKNEPNQLGAILIGLSKEKNFPVGNYAYGREKTAISKLRDALRKLTSLSGEPFKPYNQAEGWKPRFTLIYDVNNAEERAKRKAIHVGYKETDINDIDD